VTDHGKATDGLLDVISEQRDLIASLELELAEYRTIVPTVEVDPARV
jgi:hypothetical protein